MIRYEGLALDGVAVAGCNLRSNTVDMCVASTITADNLIYSMTSWCKGRTHITCS
jgi:hypothetical protein